MLVIRAYINEKEIDEVWIYNAGWKSNDIYEYRIENPKGFEHNQILHARSDGWRLLAFKALEILIDE